jgi:hypothetical protein
VGWDFELVGWCGGGGGCGCSWNGIEHLRLRMKKRGEGDIIQACRVLGEITIIASFPK